MKNKYVARKDSLHYLPTCPCVECQIERRRLEGNFSNHIAVPPQAAFLLGLINQVNPHGSLCRELSIQS